MRFSLYNPNVPGNTTNFVLGVTFQADNEESARSAVLDTPVYRDSDLVDTTYWPVGPGHIYHSDTKTFTDFMGNLVTQSLTPLG